MTRKRLIELSERFGICLLVITIMAFIVWIIESILIKNNFEKLYSKYIYHNNSVIEDKIYYPGSKIQVKFELLSLHGMYVVNNLNINCSVLGIDGNDSVKLDIKNISHAGVKKIPNTLFWKSHSPVDNPPIKKIDPITFNLPESDVFFGKEIKCSIDLRISYPEIQYNLLKDDNFTILNRDILTDFLIIIPDYSTSLKTKAYEKKLDDSGFGGAVLIFLAIFVWPIWFIVVIVIHND